MSDERLNIAEAAQRFGVSVSYLSNRRLNGGAPVVVKIGAKVVYDLAGLSAWSNARRCSSTSPSVVAEVMTRPAERPPQKTICLAAQLLKYSRTSATLGRSGYRTGGQPQGSRLSRSDTSSAGACNPHRRAGHP